MKILSLKSVLLYQLGRVLLCDSDPNPVCFTDFLQNPEKNNSNAPLTKDKKTVNWREIPLKKKQQTSHFLYVSPLPQTLIAFGQVAVGPDPSDATQAILNRLNQSHFNSKLKQINKPTVCSDQTLSIDAQLWPEFEIETQKPGWIAFRLSEKGLALWLQHLHIQSAAANAANTAPVLAPTPALTSQWTLDAPTTHMLWQVQYAHACCARLLVPTPISKVAIGQRWLAEDDIVQSLVHALVDTADSLFWIPYRWPAQQYLLLLKHIMPLCQAFERFYRVRLCESRRPYAGLSAQDIEVRSRQQSLISATKHILKVLLEEHLGELAPERL